MPTKVAETASWGNNQNQTKALVRSLFGNSQQQQQQTSRLRHASDPTEMLSFSLRLPPSARQLALKLL